MTVNLKQQPLMHSNRSNEVGRAAFSLALVRAWLLGNYIKKPTSSRFSAPNRLDLSKGFCPREYLIIKEAVPFQTMGNTHSQEDCNPSNSPKIVRFNEEVGTLESPRVDEPTPRHSYVSGEVVLRAEHTVQSHDLIAKPDGESIMGAWERETILSLDGGGVRGYSSLLILQDLMGIIAKLERRTDPKATYSAYSPVDTTDLPPASNDPNSTSDYLPCHYFNYIAGMSTGGLIAIMLGRLRMNIEDCVKEYEHLSASVFQEPPSWLARRSTRKWKALEDKFNMLRPRWPSPSEAREQPVLFKSDPCRCRTVVYCFESGMENNTQVPVLFRSYNHPMPRIARNPSTPDTVALWQVARATSAAPFYSKPYRLDNYRYYDAAIDMNNPSSTISSEVIKLAKNNSLAIDILLSIGGGNAEVSKRRSKNGGERLEKSIAVISDAIHHQVMKDNQGCFKYYRLDIDEGLQDVRLNEWITDSSDKTTLQKINKWITGSGDKTTLQKIRKATASYLQRPDVRDQLNACAANLVKRRVDRAMTVDWEYFAMGIHYKCRLEGCLFPNSRFRDRNFFLDHLRMKHNYPPPDAAHYKMVTAALDRGRTNEE